MSSTTNYGFTLTDATHLVKKENINTPVTEIDTTLQNLQSRISKLQQSIGQGSSANIVFMDDDEKRWYILLDGDGIIQGGKANSNPANKIYFVYEMANADYTVLTGKYDESGSGVIDIHSRSTDHFIANGRGQGGSGFAQYTDMGWIVIGKVKKPLTNTSLKSVTIEIKQGNEPVTKYLQVSKTIKTIKVELPTETVEIDIAAGTKLCANGSKADSVLPYSFAIWNVSTNDFYLNKVISDYNQSTMTITIYGVEETA